MQNGELDGFFLTQSLNYAVYILHNVNLLNKAVNCILCYIILCDALREGVKKTVSCGLVRSKRKRCRMF